MNAGMPEAGSQGSRQNLSPPEPFLPPFHPRCKILDAKRIVWRGLAFEESGFTGEAQAIACALSAVEAKVAKLNGASS